MTKEESMDLADSVLDDVGNGETRILARIAIYTFIRSIYKRGYVIDSRLIDEDYINETRPKTKDVPGDNERRDSIGE